MSVFYDLQDGQPVTSNGNINIYNLSGGQLSGGTLQYSQAGMEGLTGSQEFVTAAGASPQYAYSTSPQQSPASPQQQPQQNPGSPRSPGTPQQPLPSPTHQQHQQQVPTTQPPQAMPSPTHTMLPPPQDQPLALVQTQQQQQQQQQNQQPQQQANNKIPDIILTGSTATTLADLEEILSCRESTLHGQYSLTNIY